jgi:hypothetical protein
MPADRSGPKLSLAAVALALALLLFAAASPADAEADRKKAIWGPVTSGTQSLFPTYAELGVGIYQYSVQWQRAAPTRPAEPGDPSDPAYDWPTELDFAVSEAQKYGMQVSVMIQNSPPWANGGRPTNGAPKPKDLARFAAAASRRYPAVRHWQILGEPTLRVHFTPLGRKRGPQRYARILDAAYGALKSVNRANKVISGSSLTAGDVHPADWIRFMRLPNGKPPRMDMYGHNPFSPRKPNLKRGPKWKGQWDISDVDTMLEAIDENLRLGKRNKNLKIFIGEWTIPTDHAGSLFGFWGDRVTVADYLRRALRIARKVKRVYTFGWFTLLDQPPNPAGDEVNWGLLTWDFVKKPAYFTFRDG